MIPHAQDGLERVSKEELRYDQQRQRRHQIDLVRAGVQHCRNPDQPSSCLDLRRFHIRVRHGGLRASLSI
jgi:hypothetical protein